MSPMPSRRYPPPISECTPASHISSTRPSWLINVGRKARRCSSSAARCKARCTPSGRVWPCSKTTSVVGRCVVSILGQPIEATVSMTASMMMGRSISGVMSAAKRLARAAPRLKPIKTM